MSVAYQSTFWPTIGQPQSADILTNTRPTNITNMSVNTLYIKRHMGHFRSVYRNRPIRQPRGAQITQDPEIVSQPLNQCTQI